MIIDTRQLYWTEHAKAKMRQYRLSASRIKRVLRYPKRLEVGVAPDTVATMQPAGSKKHPYELWVMYATKSQNIKHKLQILNKNGKIMIISAWKYPGVSPSHEPPPIPEEVWAIARAQTGQ